MKNNRNLLKGLVACGIALAMVSSLAAQTPEQGAAKVVRMKGSARYTTGGNVWQPLKLGAVLKPGAIIQTGLDRGSYVDLVLGDGNAPLPSSPVTRPVGSANAVPPNAGGGGGAKADQNVVRLFENTVLGVDKVTNLNTGADAVTETQLDLKAGHILGTVKKMSANSKYEIKLPKGVAGIRGTWYDLTADGLLKVMDGSVVLAHVKDDGTVVTQVVNSNQQFNSQTGQLTPLAAGDMNFIETTAGGMRVVVSGMPPTGIPDNTLRWVSDNRGGSTAPPSGSNAQ
jgi:hypothetical protein